MATKTSHSESTVRAKSAGLVLVLGLMGAVYAGAVDAATPAVTAVDDVPRVAVRFHADSLTTDTGAKTVYRNIVKAAAAVCPATPSDSRLVTNVIQTCRNQAIERAVRKVNSPRLVALATSSAKIG